MRVGSTEFACPVRCLYQTEEIEVEEESRLFEALVDPTAYLSRISAKGQCRMPQEKAFKALRRVCGDNVTPLLRSL